VDLSSSIPKGNYSAKAIYPLNQKFSLKPNQIVELTLQPRVPVIITLVKDK
jgi:hypothetical protein